MKNSIPLLGLFLLVISFTSCKTETEKKAEIVTDNYIRFVDSVTHKTTADAAANWSNIEKYFENEVLPHVPDAWIDFDKTRIGYEINFTKYFYEYKGCSTVSW